MRGNTRTASWRADLFKRRGVRRRGKLFARFCPGLECGESWLHSPFCFYIFTAARSLALRERGL